MMEGERRVVVVAVAGYRVQSLLNGQKRRLKYLEGRGQTGSHDTRDERRLTTCPHREGKDGKGQLRSPG
jgi:hypothetical protein